MRCSTYVLLYDDFIDEIFFFSIQNIYSACRPMAAPKKEKPAGFISAQLTQDDQNDVRNAIAAGYSKKFDVCVQNDPKILLHFSN